MILLGTPTFFAYLALVTKRMHDFGQDLKVKFEIVSIPIWDTLRSFGEAYELFTREGDNSENKFGPPPKF